MAEKQKRKTRAELAAEYQTMKDISPQKAGESDVQYFHRLAKAADTRLTRLEQAAGGYVVTKGKEKGKVYGPKQGFESVLSYAYKQAMYDIRSLSGDRGGKRFNTAVKKNKDGSLNQAMLHAKINAVKRFLEAPTSMTSKIEESYQKRADTLNATYGTKFTWQEMGRFFESAAYDKLRVMNYGSDFILKAVGEMQKTVKPKKVEQSVQQNVRVPEDKVAGEIRDAMNAMQLSLKDFGL